ncbi:MAG: hypothetical protein NPIRA02_35970 [Nitrospirales bacterium]|nr:MAG: hypothetical protein NPIRA02_35970 [Nitrospirales bacterium]
MPILVTQDNADQGAINKKIDEVLKLKKEYMQKNIHLKLPCAAFLTPEQRVTFDMQILKKVVHGKGHGSKKGHGYKKGHSYW